MIFESTHISGVVVVRCEPRVDERGHFARTFCEKEFSGHGLHAHFLQANMSYNHEEGTLRGMHWQKSPHAEVKLVRCTRGAIYDVALDLRPDSATYLKWTAVELSAHNSLALYIPEGCAHGYLTLTPGAEVHYLVSAHYEPSQEKGARWNDPAFQIAWPFTPRLVSEKDQQHPLWIP